MRDDKCLQSLAENAEGNTSLGRNIRKWEDDVKMDLMEIGFLGA
jgi:hypothetical protein